MPHGPGKRDLNMVPPSTVGNQIEAVSTAMAQRIKKSDGITICYW